MPIRIQSVSLDDLSVSMSLSEPEYFPCNFPNLSLETIRSRSPFRRSDITLIYGGSASIAAPLRSIGAAPVAPPESSPAELSASGAIGNWSTALQTLLDRPPASLPHQLIAGGVLFCAAFAAWATVGQIDEIGQAQGRLVPQGEAYKIHPMLAGKIAHVYVQESQTVKAGQVIAELDNETARNRMEWSTQQHGSYEKELLEVETLINKTHLEAQVRLAIANAEIRAQQAAIAQSQAKIESQSGAIQQAEERLTTGQTLLDQLQQNAAGQQERVARFDALFQAGALAREQLFQAQEQLSDRQRTIIQQTGDLQQTRVDAQRLRADLQQVLAESDRLRAELVRKYAEGQEAQLQAEQTIQQLMVQRTQIQTKIQQNEEEIDQAKAELKQLTLRAPVDGVVSLLEVRKSGEVVQPGQTIAEIAPEAAPLVLEAVLPAREAGFVKLGDRAQVKFDAYPYQDYGIVAGKVTAISPDSKVDERIGAVYRVEIALDRAIVTKESEAIRLKAGQTATAEIVIRRRRIAEVLLDPIRKLQESSLSL